MEDVAAPVLPDVQQVTARMMIYDQGDMLYSKVILWVIWCGVYRL